jgi:hypothetical protein
MEAAKLADVDPTTIRDVKALTAFWNFPAYVRWTPFGAVDNSRNAYATRLSDARVSASR